MWWENKHQRLQRKRGWKNLVNVDGVMWNLDDRVEFIVWDAATSG